MINLSRRSFIKLLAAASASVATPFPKFVFSDPGIILPAYPIELSNIREMIFYSEAFDEYQIRLDAENIKFRTQIGIDFRIAGEGSALIKSYLETRKIAQKTLYDALLNEKWNAVDMRPLPLFAGYSPPKWREDMLIKA